MIKKKTADPKGEMQTADCIFFSPNRAAIFIIES